MGKKIISIEPGFGDYFNKSNHSKGAKNKLKQFEIGILNN
mgnify:CR=1 FL=1